MASTNIVPFALGVGSNVLDPATYGALTSTSQGYIAGIAQSQQLNTTWRQSAFMAAALANFLVSQGITQNDDGNLPGAVINIQQAIKQLVGAPNVFTGGTTTGAANAQVLATVIPSSGFALNNGYTVVATAGFTNTGATTMNIQSTGPQPVKKLSGASLVALTGGEIVNTDNFSINWNTTNACWVLQTTPTLGALAFLNIGAGLANDGSGNLAATNGVPPGCVFDFTSNVTPTGYLQCFGQAVSRTTYAALFAVISTTYGVGDGSTTFNLPDYRGRVSAAPDNMGGTPAGRLTTATVNSISLAGVGGEQTHTLVTAELAQHNHTYTAGINIGAAGGQAAGIGGEVVQNQGLTTGTTGSGLPHNNLQPTILINKIIKT